MKRSVAESHGRYETVVLVGCRRARCKVTVFGKPFRLERRHFEMVGKRRAIRGLGHLRQFVSKLADVLGEFGNADVLLIGQSYAPYWNPRG